MNALDVLKVACRNFGWDYETKKADFLLFFKYGNFKVDEIEYAVTEYIEETLHQGEF
jgi:hypothetical protein